MCNTLEKSLILFAFDIKYLFNVYYIQNFEWWKINPMKK